MAFKEQENLRLLSQLNAEGNGEFSVVQIPIYGKYDLMYEKDGSSYAICGWMTPDELNKVLGALAGYRYTEHPEWCV